jgi:Outer membrane protein beta-barrel domain
MKKVSIFLFATLLSLASFAQKTTTVIDKAADHFMFQLANNYWSGADAEVSSHIKGFNRSANVYAMYNKKFKTNPKFSVGVGVGVSTSNIYFNKMEMGITGATKTLAFVRTDTGSSFKKYKLATSYLEIPLELRFTANPANPNKSIKGALGVKVGTLLNAHTKGKTLRNAAGNTIGSFTEKETSKAYFNTTRISATARVGYGLYSLFGSYALTNLFKDGVAPDTKTFQIGITISGL